MRSAAGTTPSRLTEEAAHPPVGEHLAAGLAVRAVDDPVRFEVDEPERLAAPRARLAVVAVDAEQAPVVLAGQHAALPLAALGHPALEHLLERDEQPLATLLVEPGRELERRQLGAVQDLVGEG